MRFVAASLAVLSIQWALVSRASLGCATPDLPLAFVLYLGLRGQKPFPFLGLWAFGLVIDLLGPYPTGLHSLAFPALGWAAAKVANRVDPSSPAVRLATLTLGVAGLRAMQLVALGAEGARPSPIQWLHFVGTSAVLTALVGFLAFQVFDRAFQRNAPVLQIEG
ncbi:MAG: rod shape-determining protein MreD [Planctomycetota bacterium]|jgi:rod shape-determining protein MreD